MSDAVNISVRDAVEVDLAKVHQIFNQIILNTTATFEEHSYSLDSWRQIFDQKRREGFPFYVTEIGNLVVGYGSYGSFRKASGYRVTVEHSLHVDEHDRGLGVGSLILKRLIAHAKSGGKWAMVAGIDSENVTSLSLHQRFGFTESGRLTNVAEKFSKPLSLTFMKLDLRD